MIKSCIVCLKPNKSQEQQFWQFSNTARFVFNECLSYKILKYQEEGVSLRLQDLIEHIQYLKNSEEYAWIKDTPEAVSKQAIKDLETAFLNFNRRGNKGFPKFKSKKKTRASFYQRTDRIRQIDNKHIKITGIKTPVKCSSFILPEKVYNTKVFYDGKYWYLTYSYDIDVTNAAANATGEVIGIDLGIKNLAVCSDGQVYKNINKDNTIKKILKNKKRLQKQLSRKYTLNDNKSKNAIKLEHKLKMLDRRLKNIRNTYIHEVTTDLVRNKPKAIVIEDLSVKDMYNMKTIAEAVQAQQFRKFRNYLEYKTKENGIELLVADRFFPSSKKCSCCGSIKNDLTLKDRVFKCNTCGFVIDRDYNSSINLKEYYFNR